MLKRFGLEQSDEGNTSKYGSANQYMWTHLSNEYILDKSDPKRPQVQLFSN